MNNHFGSRLSLLNSPVVLACTTFLRPVHGERDERGEKECDFEGKLQSESFVEKSVDFLNVRNAIM